MAEKQYYTDSEGNQHEYNPNSTYIFKDKDGNTFESRGDNGYVWQAITNGLPISVNEKGEWYVEPYLDVTPDSIVSHVPDWFKGTSEYTEWKNKYDSYLQPGINKDTFNQLNDILKGYGAQGASRVALSNRVKNFGITDSGLVDKYASDYINMYNEGNGLGSANISIYGEDGRSVADIVREYKDLSKEDLSRYLESLYKAVDFRNSDAWTGDLDQQKIVLSALQTLEILNHVDDNYSKYGDDDEFKGLLQASQWQKIYSGIEASNLQLTNNILALPARVVHGIASLIFDEDHTFDTRLSQYNDYTTDPYAGAYLEGREGFISIGNTIGTVENMVTTFAVSAQFGAWLNGVAAGMAGTGGAVLSAMGSFMQTPVGSMVTDFFLHDIPIDVLNMFTVLSENGGDWGKAWNDPTQQQNLIAIPLIGELGPKVDAGLKNDIIGDLIVDFSLPVLGMLGKTMNVGIDSITNGAATRFKEYVAVKNLQLQDTLTKTPVLGKAWKKMIDGFMGAENAEMIRDARKASIAEGSMDAYKRAQNILTLKNHGGAEDVVNLYQDILKKNGVVEDVKHFQKQAKKYGGVGKTEVTWKETKGGKTVTKTRTVPDVVPKQVKQGLLDIERLAELRGQKVNDGGIIHDTAREKEIASLEQRVAKLPQEIKDFADRFSTANKELEKVGVKLGITNEDWRKAMDMNPEFEKYMVRQALVPVSDKVGSAEKPAILNKSRKGYYAKNYIDPIIAFNMKAAALGRAHAWNQQAKVLVAQQIAQGKVIAGKGGVETSKKLQEVKDKIANVEAVRKALNYDGVTSAMSKEVKTISTAINDINELLNAPNNISLKSIYTAATSPAINEFTGAFKGGQIRFGDDVRGAAGLSDADAAKMVENTYSIVDASSKAESISAADNINIANNISNNKGLDYSNKTLYNEGVAVDGTAYRYKVENGVITEIKEITDAPALANTIKKLGGVYDIDVATVNKIGVENARAINRTIMFYRENMPNLSNGVTKFKTGVEKGAYGWILKPSSSDEYNYRIVDGQIECDFSIYLGEPYYLAGHERNTLNSYRAGEASRDNPKNTSSLEYTPIHENGHATMARLSVLSLNRDISEGKIKIPENASKADIARIVHKRFVELHDELAKRALKNLGYKVDEMSDAKFREVWQKLSYDTISRYAGDKRVFWVETFSEAMADVWGNGASSSKFSLAIVEQMKLESQKYAMAADPIKVMEANGLDYPKTMFKDGQYNFPASAKTGKQKAQWLAKHRKENPYLNTKGVFNTDQYIKANLWDTYFKKEIESYDPTVKTKMPDGLTIKNGEFLEDLANNTAKKLVEKIKSASVEGFDENLATIALGANKADSAEALDNFIISRVNNAAQKLAEKMPGGAIEENLNQARITLWQDSSIKQDMTNLLSSLAPELSLDDVVKKVDTLFTEQANGFASYEALSVDYKNLNEERKKLVTELEQSNKYAIAQGKKIDKELRGDGYINDATQTIHYKEGGEDVYVVVRDPEVASILKRPDDFSNKGITPNSLVYAANSIARLYRLGTTGVNPIAIVRNVLRDPLEAMFTAGVNPLTMNLNPMAFYKSLRQYGLDDATIKVVESKLKTWASTGTMTNEIRKFGGELPSTVGYASRSEKFSKNFNNKVADSKIINFGEQPLEIWESTFRNQIAQQSFTKAMRRTNGDVDKSLASAMFDASNATTNFSHSIYFMRKITASTPYLASAINGTASFWRLFNTDPIGMMGRITAGVMVPAMALTAWNLSSEERRKTYMNLPEWYRDGHVVLIDNENNVFSLPIPDPAKPFINTIRRLVEYTNDASPNTIPSILAQGAFGFVPADLDGFFNPDGSLNIQRGIGQLASGIMPQAATVLYELAFQEKLYTGQDISDYSTFNVIINALGNTFGSFATNIINDIGFLCGASDNLLVGKTTAETLSRDLFGMGFDNAKQQFMELVGKPSSVDEKGREIKATGLFAESEKIQKRLEAIDKEIAFATEEEKEKLLEEKEKLVEDFGQRVSNLTNKYMSLFSTTGGLEEWQRKKLIQILGMGGAVSSATEGSYQQASASQADLDEYALGRQRYVDLGLPTDPTIESLTLNENGNLQNSIELQAAIDRFYGSPKQATQDYINAIEESGIKDIRNEFYGAIQQIYDLADANGTDPDYDMIEKIQARYLQSIDSVLVPIINKYGISVLNNSDFIDAVRKQVSGMIPSDDWKQSRRNAKKFLSTKDFPTATVDVKKWLKERYTSGMRNRNIDSDPEVSQKLESIKNKIDTGQTGAARGEIDDLKKGVSKSNYYISSEDMLKLNEYANMLK